MEIPEIVRTYIDAFTSSDLRACVATFARDGTYSDPNTTGPLAPEQIEDYFSGVFARYPNAVWETVALEAVSEDMCVWRWVLRGTHKGSTSGETATGQRVTLPGCEFITVRCGKIYQVEGYFDRLTALQQLGVSSPSTP